MSSSKLDSVKEYYGKIIKQSTDLKTDCCTTSAKPTPAVLRALNNVHPEVTEKYYGCGLVFPDKLDGCRVLDLGSGSGRDCYVLSQLVGQNGFVVGVDMTREQLNVADKYVEYHREKFGYPRANVKFLEGYIEDLESLGLEANSFDLVISNCVVNLSPDKEAVLRQVLRVLREGGEFYFSDVYSSRRIPRSLQDDPELWGECIAGALYVNDFLALARRLGFVDPRRVSTRPLAVRNSAIQAKIAEHGPIELSSSTYRLFKIQALEPTCEDYGQAVAYAGPGNTFKLDEKHRSDMPYFSYEKGRIVPTCRNGFNLLYHSRFRSEFVFYGAENTRHYGPWDCSKDGPASTTESDCDSGCC